MDILLKIGVFILGLSIIAGTLLSAISSFILPRSARSRLNRIVFGALRFLFDKLLLLAKSFDKKDAIFAYYAPVSLLMLVPTWYILIALGYAGMYWALGVGDLYTSFILSGSSLLTLGFATSEGLFVHMLIFSEATLGLILVALLIAYLPTMYSAFSRRERYVNLLDVRAGTPPSSLEMLMRYNRIHGFERLGDYWRAWETWFAEIEESHSKLPALVFFRSPRRELSWVTAAGTVLDAAALSMAVLEIPYDPSAALCVRAGFIALQRISHNFDLPYPEDPQFPKTPISITEEEFYEVLNELKDAGVPLKEDRAQAWQDFAGWRVNYDHSLIELSDLIMAPYAFWSSDR